MITVGSWLVSKGLGCMVSDNSDSVEESSLYEITTTSSCFGLTSTDNESTTIEGLVEKIIYSCACSTTGIFAFTTGLVSMVCGFHTCFLTSFILIMQYLCPTRIQAWYEQTTPEFIEKRNSDPSGALGDFLVVTGLCVSLPMITVGSWLVSKGLGCMAMGCLIPGSILAHEKTRTFKSVL